ncbi:hypothetical protein V2S04_12220 [Microbacterium sp. OR21]|uniref:hypothetical protein n=1 Tax=Microbacterium sp. OR21 TaxID=3095346 RepID=UPI0039B677D2
MSFDRRGTGLDDDAPSDDDAGVLYEDQVEPEYGIIGFTLRELILVGAWLVGFVVSFFPIGPIGDTIWSTGIHWILMMGLPTAAVFLIVLRRLSPEGIRRVGSLGIDQFASVAASVAAVSWAQILWQQVAATIATGAILIGWVAVVGQLAMLALVAATVFAPVLPRLQDDFRGRMETLAHRNANPVRPVISRPRPERETAPSAAAPQPDEGEADLAADQADASISEPRVNTALTVVIPAAEDAGDAPAAPDNAGGVPAAPDAAGDVPAAPNAADQATGDQVAGAFEAAHHETSAQPAELTSDRQTTTGDADEVLYNTAAVEALRDIFAVDATTNPRRPVEHNTARDGIAGSVGEDAPADVDAVSAETADPRPTRSASTPQEPFWILAPTDRDVLDEHGEPLFRVGPTAWALAIEDRGGAFVVRHEDGRIGYLHDISDITKG